MNNNKTLIIVESPHKAKTIQGHVGDDYIVRASKGHITDLAKGGSHGLGIDVNNNFKPKYVIIDDQLSTLEMLVAEAEKCSNILLCGDPDREGVSISYQLQERLKDLDKPIKHIEIHEITKQGVMTALKNPHDVNMSMVFSQQARRILDRLVGFMVSPFLMTYFGQGLSAGRVQSVVTKMVVDREREIENFKPEEYWNIHANLANSLQESFTAKYDGKITNKSDADKLKAELSGNNFGAIYIVNSVEAKEEKKKPGPPMITAKLQQIMSKNGMSPEKTMKAAQSLYENGYITYMRTDSVRLSDEALKMARTWLKDNGYNVPKTANKFKNKDAAQDAHEACRPTDLSILPSSSEFTGDEKLVYQTIWRYFLASQMESAIYNTLKVTIKLKSNPKISLKTAGKALKSKGYLEILKIEDKSQISIPSLKKGEELSLSGKAPVLAEQKWTQPLSRYSEAKLIEALEDREIGRPSSYADLLTKLTSRNYVEKHDNSVFYPTVLGNKITDELTQFFSFMDYHFTAQMEKKLDAIADGKTNHIDMLKEFFLPFREELNKAYSNHGAQNCPKCKNPMILRTSKITNDKFWGCTQYPHCSGTKSNESNQINA